MRLLVLVPLLLAAGCASLTLEERKARSREEIAEYQTLLAEGDLVGAVEAIEDVIVVEAVPLVQNAEHRTHPDPAVRLGIATAAVSMVSSDARAAGVPPGEIAPVLVDLLEDPDEDVRATARFGVDRLGLLATAALCRKIQPPEHPADAGPVSFASSEPYFGFLAKPASEHSAALLNALGKVVADDEVAPAGKLAAIVVMRDCQDRSGAKLLAAGLADDLEGREDPAEIAEVARTLTALGEDVAPVGETLLSKLPPAEESGDDPAPDLMLVAVIRALDAIGHHTEASVSRVAGYLGEDQSSKVRQASARSLGGAESPIALGVLRAYSSSDDPEVALAVLASFERLGSYASDALPEARAALSHEESRVRIAAVRAVSSIGRRTPAKVADALAVALADGSDAVVEAAAKVFGELGEDGVRVVRRLLASDDPAGSRSGALRAVTRMGAIAAPLTAPIVAFFRGEDAALRQETLEPLAAIGEPAVEPVFEVVLSPPDADAMRLGEDVLVDIGAPAVPTLVRSIEEDPSSDGSKSARRCLVRIGGPAVDGLVASLEASDDLYVKHALIELVGEIGLSAKEKAMPMLLEAREDPDLKGAAEEALLRMGWTAPEPGEAADEAAGEEPEAAAEE